MSRTHRIHPNKMHRRPKTFNLIRMNEGLMADVRTQEYEHTISKMNRTHRHIPGAWDDLPISSNYEYNANKNFN